MKYGHFRGQTPYTGHSSFDIRVWETLLLARCSLGSFCQWLAQKRYTRGLNLEFPAAVVLPARPTSGSVVNVEKEPKSTFAAPQAASPWARAAHSRARQPYPPPPALGSRPASSAGFSCWAARQQEHDLRHVQRVVTAPLWLPSFGARDGNDPRHPLHRVGVLGSGGRHSPATSVGCPSLATVGVPSSRLLGAAHSEDFMICVCI